MKKLLFALLLIGLFFVPMVSYGEDYLTISYSGLTQEVISEGGMSPPIIVKESSFAIDNNGSLYLVETWADKDCIYIFDKNYNYYHGSIAYANNGYKIKTIDFDNSGNMFCVLQKDSQDMYGLHSHVVVIKVGGFSSLKDEIANLQDKIDNIQLIPGPQGPPGITPTEIAVIQSQITTLQQRNSELKQQNKALQDIINKITSYPPLKAWLWLRKR